MTSPTSRRLEIEFTGDTSDVQRAVRRVQATVRRAVARMDQLQATIKVNANTSRAQRQVAIWRRQQEARPVNIRVQANLRSIRQVSQSILQLTRGFNLLGLVVGGLSTLTFLVGAATAVTAMATSLGFALVSLTAMVPAALGLAAAFTTVALAADRIKESEGWKQLKADIEELKDVTGDELVPAFNEFYREAQRNFPILRSHFQNLASILGAGLVDVGRFLGGNLAGEQLTNIFGVNERAIAALARAVRPLTGIILSLAEAAAPQFERFARALERALNRFDAFLLRTRATGELADFFEETGDEMAKWGRIFRNVFTGMGNLISGAIGPSREWASAFERITAQFREWSAQEQVHENVRRFFEFMRDLPYGDLLQIVAAITTMIVAFKGVQGIITIVSGFAGFVGAIVGAGAVLGPILAVLGLIVVALGLVAGGFVLAYTESAKFREIANDAIAGFASRLVEIKDQAADTFQIVRDHWTRWAESNDGLDRMRELRASFTAARDAAVDLWNTIVEKIEQFKSSLEGARGAFDQVFGGFTDIVSSVNDGFADITDQLSILLTSIAPAEGQFNLVSGALGVMGVTMKGVAVVITFMLKGIASLITQISFLVITIQEAGEWISYLSQVLANPSKAWTLEPPWKNGWLTGLDEVRDKAKELAQLDLEELNRALEETKESGDIGAQGLQNFANTGTTVKQKVDELRDAYKLAFGEEIPQSVNDAFTEIENRATAHEAYLAEVFKYERIKAGVAELRAAIEAAGIEIAPEWEQAFSEIEAASDGAKSKLTSDFDQIQQASGRSFDEIQKASGRTRQKVESDATQMTNQSRTQASQFDGPWRGGGGAFGRIEGASNDMRRGVSGQFSIMEQNAIGAALNAAAQVGFALSNIRVTAPSMNFQNIVNAAFNAAATVRSILSGLGGIFNFRALGGPVAPPAWAKRAALGASRASAFWVGEHGPELFIPSQPGRIVNSSASARIASEQPDIDVNVVFTGLPEAFAEFVDVRVTTSHRDQRRFDDGGSSIGGW